MIKKNLTGIIVVILIIAAFFVGYSVGKPSGDSQPSNQAGMSSRGMDEAKPEQSRSDNQTRVISGETSAKLENGKTTQDSNSSVNHSFYGYTSPHETVNVQGNRGGTIVRLEGDEGHSVEKGDLLLQIDEQEIQLELQKSVSSKNAALQQIQQAELDSRTAQSTLDRNKPLHDKGMISEQAWDDMESKLASAQLSLENAKRTLEQATLEVTLNEKKLKEHQVFSPISGIIDAKSFNVNEIYQAGAVAYRIINIDRVYLEASVSESYINQFKENMRVSVSFDALKDSKFNGTVSDILPSGSSDSNSFVIKVLISNPDHLVKPGMFARIDVDLGGK